MRSVSRRSGRLVLGGLAALVVAGCAGSGPSVQPPVATASLPSPPAVSVMTTTASDRPPPASSSRAAAPSTATAPGDVTVSGTVIEGAQPGCRNLQTDDDGRYTLTGPGTAALTVGDRVTVTGQPRPDLISPCGRVFVVTSIR